MHKNKGFTLIELLIVMVFIAIIASIAGAFTIGNSSWSDTFHGVRCVAGYKVVVGPYNTEQMRDIDNRPIPCN